MNVRLCVVEVSFWLFCRPSVISPSSPVPCGSRSGSLTVRGPPGNRTPAAQLRSWLRGALLDVRGALAALGMFGWATEWVLKY